MIPWPFALVGWLIAVPAVALAVVQTRRLRDRPTRWETQQSEPTITTMPTPIGYIQAGERLMAEKSEADVH